MRVAFGYEKSADGAASILHGDALTRGRRGDALKSELFRRHEHPLTQWRTEPRPSCYKRLHHLFTTQPISNAIRRGWPW